MPSDITRFKPGKPKTGGRTRGTPNKATLEIREAARRLLEDPRYRRRVSQRLQAGRLAPQIEALLYHYAYGKPKQTLSVEEPHSLSELLRLAIIERQRMQALQAGQNQSVPGQEVNGER